MVRQILFTVILVVAFFTCLESVRDEHAASLKSETGNVN
jgi:hypothetical protein